MTDTDTQDAISFVQQRNPRRQDVMRGDVRLGIIERVEFGWLPIVPGGAPIEVCTTAVLAVKRILDATP